jgi:hypothetical protein
VNYEYIPEEEIGCRLENDYLLTDDDKILFELPLALTEGLKNRYPDEGFS